MFLFLIVALLNSVKYEQDLKNSFRVPPLVSSTSGRTTPKLMNFIPVAPYVPPNRIALTPKPYEVEFDG